MHILKLSTKTKAMIPVIIFITLIEFIVNIMEVIIFYYVLKTHLVKHFL